MAGNTSAVDGRHVFGVKRMQVLRFIPVKKMSSELFKFIHGAEGFFEPFCCGLSSNPAEVTRREGGKQIQADVRRRSSVSDDWSRVFLKIIWRKEIIHGSDKGFEETPRAARSQAQSHRLGSGKSL